jgi:phosphoglycolate phosphatase-like HAD superfamily hydrolase
MIKAIFFDFDGVIMDSMTLKLDAYCECLDGFGFARTDVDRIMRERMGQSRYRIIVEIYEQLLGKTIPPDLFETALATFNRLDEAAREKIQFLPGSLEFIRKVHADRFTAVVTGTPEEFILKTTAHHNLDQYFDIVRGSPDMKPDIVAELLRDHSIRTEESIFIGDGKTDQDAADCHGIRFVGFDNGDYSFDPDSAWKIVTNLDQLIPTIDEPSQMTDNE